MCLRISGVNLEKNLRKSGSFEIHLLFGVALHGVVTALQTHDATRGLNALRLSKFIRHFITADPGIDVID
jgi:hypothetical protein